MQPDRNIFRAMIACPYKAWQLAKSEPKSQFSWDILQRTNILHEKLADAAWNYWNAGLSGQIQKSPQKVKTLVEGVTQMLNNDSPPAFYKNTHCSECLFWESCYPKLKEKDCISLLAGMTPKVISKYHSKGIFTVLQLSHLFRLRRRRRSLKVTGRFLWELKALAIREKKTYVLQLPECKSHPSIYIDFEGIQNENFIYLIGIVIMQNDVPDKTYSFWANEKKAEVSIFEELIKVLLIYPEANIYHYGSFESTALKQYVKDNKNEELFSTIEKRMINILGYFRTHVYPPTYGNGLKEIARFLGYKWQYEGDGRLSIIWRKSWETTQDASYKSKLIRYNLDDCFALAKVHGWLNKLTSESEQDDVQQISKMKKYSPYKLQNNPEFGANFQYISKAAYFDYQRSKIYWRGEHKFSPMSTAAKKKQPKHSGRGKVVWFPKKVNKVIRAPQLQECPHCGNTKVYHRKKISTFRQTNLKFTSSGIRQWVTQYEAGIGKCAKCRKGYNDAILMRRMYGDNIFAWAINLYVQYNVSYAMISRLLNEQFNIWANPVYFNDRNYKWWQRFKPDVEYCKQTILKSPVIHIDETTIRLAKNKVDRAYVWVLATPHTVFYHLTLNHEADFLKEWLKDYQGVIVTDFFPVYESIPVKQQKCLIHLIRDLNDDLFKNPFDIEFKGLVNAFNELLRKVVITIDLYGLKKRNLNKHRKDTAAFYLKYIERDYTSALSMKYAKRFKKHWDEIWPFLSFDNVPWNNNNAEAAIKAFAQHRHNVNGQVTEGGIREYLSMLSVSQTCRYREISFLDFLRGEAGLWQNISPDMLPDYLPFNQAKAFMNVNKISQTKWERFLRKRPSFIPKAPDLYYNDKGWVSWQDWFYSS